MFEKLFYFNKLTSNIDFQKAHEFIFLKSYSDWKTYISKLTSIYTEESYSSAGVPINFPCFVITLYQHNVKMSIHKFDHYFLDLDHIIEELIASNLTSLLTHENKITREFAKKLTDK